MDMSAVGARQLAEGRCAILNAMVTREMTMADGNLGRQSSPLPRAGTTSNIKSIAAAPSPGAENRNSNSAARSQGTLAFANSPDSQILGSIPLRKDSSEHD